MTYDCMTPDELALWRRSAKGITLDASRPCIDCPMWFELQAKDAGCCKRVRVSEHRAAQMREAQRRARQRAKERAQ